MQLQFNKTVIPCLHTVKRDLQTLEQTQEIRLTDDLPDIGKVIAGWGQPVIRSKEWRAGSASVSGGVMVWVLYAPEDGDEVRCVETWLPFQMKWEIPETKRDGSIHVIPCLRGVDARSLSARKIMVRAGICALGEIMLPMETETLLPENLPEDVQVLQNTYPVQLPIEAGEKSFSMEETLSIPTTEPKAAKLIRYEIQPRVMENRVVGDKLVIRGAGDLTLVYMDEDHRLHKWKFELPFSQYTELDGEYGADAEAAIYMVVTALELELGEEGLQLKAGLTAQYVIWGRMTVETVEDLYSPYRPVEISKTRLQLPARLNSWTESVPTEWSAVPAGLRLVDAVFYPDPPQLRQEPGGPVAELSGVFQMLGYHENGEVECEFARWSQERKLSVGENVCMDVTVQTTGDGLTLGVCAFSPEGIPMVTAVEMAQETMEDPDRPSLILRRVGAEGLWELAKETGSTVAAIRKANGLQQEPEEGQMLLIPVS